MKIWSTYINLRNQLDSMKPRVEYDGQNNSSKPCLISEVLGPKLTWFWYCFLSTFCSSFHRNNHFVQSPPPPKKKKKPKKKSYYSKHFYKEKLKSLIQLSQQNFKWYKGAKTDDPYNTTVGLIIFTQWFFLSPLQQKKCGSLTRPQLL